MADVFEEVEEAIREDRYRTLWRRVMPVVVGIAVFLVAGTATREFLVWQSDRTQAANAEVFDAAYDHFAEGRFVEAEAALQPIVTEGGDFAPLAAHYLSQAQLAASGDQAAATQTLESAGMDDAPLARLALMKSAYLQADDLSLAELEALLAPLMDNAGGFGALARELIAAKALASDDLDRAEAEYNTLRFSLDAPRGVTQRSEQALAVIEARKQAIEDQ